MAERPILFSAPMVRAILADTKTQTRRVVKPVGDDDGFVLQDYGDGWWPFRSDDGESSMKGGSEIPHRCPYGTPGDQLWVREAYRFLAVHDHVPPRELSSGPVWYEAQDDVPFHPSNVGKLRPGMFMPRWASCITLEVTGVRVERLQDISEADALAEGIERIPPTGAGAGPNRYSLRGEDGWINRPTAAECYRVLWEQINGPGAWDANPWVWVVEFRRVEANHG